MSVTKRFFYWLSIITLGFIINVIITITTQSRGHVSVQTTEFRCRQITYVESGFPIRSVYVEATPDDVQDEECGGTLNGLSEDGAEYLYFVLLNWAFYSFLVQKLIDYRGSREK